MRIFLALFRKETAAVFLSAPILFAAAFFILLDSFAFYLTLAVPAEPQAVFDDIGLFIAFTSIIMYPLVAMRAFAEEHAAGTMETLLTAPVGPGTVVLAKFAAAMVFVAAYLLHGAFYAFLLALGGRLDINSALAALAALFATGALAMALGCLLSALTASAAAAAAGTAGVLILLLILAEADPYAGALDSILNSLSFLPHARRWMGGEVDTRSLVYFLSATAFLLMCATLATGWRTLSPAARRRAWLGAGLALVVVANANWLAHYPFQLFADDRALGFLTVLRNRSLDVSDDGRNSLSPTAGRILDGLQGRLQAYAFLADGLEQRGVPVAEEMRRLLIRCGERNTLVAITFADAGDASGPAADVARDLRLQPRDLENTLVLDYQGRRQVVPAAALVAPPDWQAQTAGSDAWTFDGENRLFQTIQRLADPRVPNVFFTYGRMEHDLTPGPYPERSVSRLARSLAGANMRVRQHSLASGQPIPPECDILAVAAPRMPFQERDAAVIRRYLERGGRLCLFLPDAGGAPRTGDDALAQLAFELGGGFRDDAVTDREHNDNGLPLAPLGRPKGAADGAAHFVFPAARSIRDNPRAGENGWTCERMLESFPTAMAENPADGSLRPGPFTLVYRSWKEEGDREARAAVFASGRMAADADIGRGANEALILGMFQWLAGREEIRDIEPRPAVDRSVTLTGLRFVAALWAGTAVPPLAWLLAGVLVWWRRRE